MMERDRDRAVFLGLAALQDFANQAHQHPLDATIQLRALLALMALQSRGDLSAYRDFWEVCRATGQDGQHVGGQNYERGTNADILVKRIARTVGVEPVAMSFHDAIQRVLRASRVTHPKPVYIPKRGDCGWL
jgi:hypothetical protein